MLQSVFPFIPEKAWMATIDLQDACFHISIRPSHCKYVRFAVGDSHYHYAPLPFPTDLHKVYGGRSCPFLSLGFADFPVHRQLIASGFLTLLTSHITITITLLKSLGVIVSTKKSSHNLVRRLQYIGTILYSVSAMVSLPPDRAESLWDFCLHVQSSLQVTAFQIQ